MPSGHAATYVSTRTSRLPAGTWSGSGCAVQEVGEELEIFVVIAGADLVHRGVHAQVDEVEAVTGVAAAMVVRVTNEP